MDLDLDLDEIVETYTRPTSKPEIVHLAHLGCRDVNPRDAEPYVLWEAEKFHVDCTEPYWMAEIKTADVYFVHGTNYCRIPAGRWAYDIRYCPDRARLVAALRAYNRALAAQAVTKIFADLVRGPTPDVQVDIDLFRCGYDNAEVDHNRWVNIALPFLRDGSFARVSLFHLQLPIVGDRVVYYVDRGKYYRTTDRENYLYALATGGAPSDAAEVTPVVLTLDDIEAGVVP